MSLLYPPPRPADKEIADNVVRIAGVILGLPEVLPLSVHFLVQLEPRPGKAAEFREALLQVVTPTRAEPGCLRIQVYESLREPPLFAIHSEWADESAFETHAKLPHTLRFLAAATELLAHPLQGLRSRELA